MTDKQKIVNLIAEQLSVDVERVQPSAGFVEDLGADSLDLVELVMVMEEAFEIEISDDKAEAVTTVQDYFELLGVEE